MVHPRAGWKANNDTAVDDVDDDDDVFFSFFVRLFVVVAVIAVLMTAPQTSTDKYIRGFILAVELCPLLYRGCLFIILYILLYIIAIVGRYFLCIISFNGLCAVVVFYCVAMLIIRTAFCLRVVWIFFFVENKVCENHLYFPRRFQISIPLIIIIIYYHYHFILCTGRVKESILRTWVLSTGKHLRYVVKGKHVSLDW